ncbi:unnamed protein product [Closterium sp. NIES-65]|nr:unnamed protein product [Closterium sp. NIES-65]
MAADRWGGGDLDGGEDAWGRGEAESEGVWERVVYQADDRGALERLMKRKGAAGGRNAAGPKPLIGEPHAAVSALGESAAANRDVSGVKFGWQGLAASNVAEKERGDTWQRAKWGLRWFDSPTADDWRAMPCHACPSASVPCHACPPAVLTCCVPCAARCRPIPSLPHAIHPCHIMHTRAHVCPSIRLPKSGTPCYFHARAPSAVHRVCTAVPCCQEDGFPDDHVDAQAAPQAADATREAHDAGEGEEAREAVQEGGREGEGVEGEYSRRVAEGLLARLSFMPSPHPPPPLPPLHPPALVPAASPLPAPMPGRAAGKASVGHARQEMQGQAWAEGQGRSQGGEREGSRGGGAVGGLALQLLQLTGAPPPLAHGGKGRGGQYRGKKEKVRATAAPAPTSSQTVPAAAPVVLQQQLSQLHASQPPQGHSTHHCQQQCEHEVQTEAVQPPCYQPQSQQQQQQQQDCVRGAFDGQVR